MSFFADDFFLPFDRHLRVFHVDEVTIKRVSRPPNGHVHWPGRHFTFHLFLCVSFNFSFSFRSFRFYFLFVHFCLFALAIHHHVVGSLTASRHTFIHFGWLCSMFSLYPHLGATKSVAIRTQKRRNHLNFQSKFQSLFHAIVTYLTHN